MIKLSCNPRCQKWKGGLRFLPATIFPAFKTTIYSASPSIIILSTLFIQMQSKCLRIVSIHTVRSNCHSVETLTRLSHFLSLLEAAVPRRSALKMLSWKRHCFLWWPTYYSSLQTAQTHWSWSNCQKQDSPSCCHPVFSSSLPVVTVRQVLG